MAEKEKKNKSLLKKPEEEDYYQTYGEVLLLRSFPRGTQPSTVRYPPPPVRPRAPVVNDYYVKSKKLYNNYDSLPSTSTSIPYQHILPTTHGKNECPLNDPTKYDRDLAKYREECDRYKAARRATDDWYNEEPQLPPISVRRACGRIRFKQIRNVEELKRWVAQNDQHYPFEYPRQQRSRPPTPEVAQYQATQRLQQPTSSRSVRPMPFPLPDELMDFDSVNSEAATQKKKRKGKKSAATKSQIKKIQDRAKKNAANPENTQPVFPATPRGEPSQRLNAAAPYGVRLPSPPVAAPARSRMRTPKHKEQTEDAFKHDTVSVLANAQIAATQVADEIVKERIAAVNQVMGEEVQLSNDIDMEMIDFNQNLRPMQVQPDPEIQIISSTRTQQAAPPPQRPSSPTVFEDDDGVINILDDGNQRPRGQRPQRLPHEPNYDGVNFLQPSISNAIFLNDDAWASDETITAFLAGMIHHHAFSTFNEIALLDTYALTVRDQTVDIRRYLRMYSDNPELILCPINIRGGHWTLLSINVLNNTATYYDPLYNTQIRGIPSHHRAICNQILRRLREAFVINDETRLIEADFTTFNRQPDFNSCGYFVMMIAEDIARDGFSTRHPYLNVVKERRRINWICHRLYHVNLQMDQLLGYNGTSLPTWPQLEDREDIYWQQIQLSQSSQLAADNSLIRKVAAMAIVRPAPARPTRQSERLKQQRKPKDPAKIATHIKSLQQLGKPLGLDSSELYPDEHYLGPMNKRCEFCRAYLFEAEDSSKCCANGTVPSPIYRPPPPIFENIRTHDEYWRNVRGLNTDFAMVSTCSTINFTDGIFKVQGETKHNVGDLIPYPDRPETFAQVYTIDAETAKDYRFRDLKNKIGYKGNEAKEAECKEVIGLIEIMLRNYHPLAKELTFVKDQLAAYEAQCAADGTEVHKLFMVWEDAHQPENPTATHIGRLNRPTVPGQVFGVYKSDDGGVFPRGIRFGIKKDGSNHLTVVPRFSSHVDAAAFPLIFPYGDEGWHTGIPKLNPNAPAVPVQPLQHPSTSATQPPPRPSTFTTQPPQCPSTAATQPPQRPSTAATQPLPRPSTSSTQSPQIPSTSAPQQPPQPRRRGRPSKQQSSATQQPHISPSIRPQQPYRQHPLFPHLPSTSGNPLRATAATQQPRIVAPTLSQQQRVHSANQPQVLPLRSPLADAQPLVRDFGHGNVVSSFARPPPQPSTAATQQPLRPSTSTAQPQLSTAQPQLFRQPLPPLSADAQLLVRDFGHGNVVSSFARPPPQPSTSATQQPSRPSTLTAQPLLFPQQLPPRSADAQPLTFVDFRGFVHSSNSQPSPQLSTAVTQPPPIHSVASQPPTFSPLLSPSYVFTQDLPESQQQFVQPLNIVQEDGAEVETVNDDFDNFDAFDGSSDEDEQERRQPNVSMNQHIRARVFDRTQKEKEDINLINGSRQLSQQYWINAYLGVEAQRLDYMAKIQDNNKWRYDQCSRLAKELERNIQKDPTLKGGKLGKVRLLRKSYRGGKRYMHHKFRNGIAINNKCGKDDLFVTFTGNPNWREIRENLRPGETWIDRPDLVCRVFNLKACEFLKDLLDKHRGVLGKTLAYKMALEHQKRGMPHLHILITMKPECKFTTPEMIDDIIRGQLPEEPKETDEDYDAKKRYFDYAMLYMIHDPSRCAVACGKSKKRGICSKGFPQAFAERTILRTDGYAQVKRPDDGREFMIKKNTRNPIAVNNQWVVPHNRWLLLKYNCHINVEHCGGVKAVKYLHKYLNKGHDRAFISVKETLKAPIKDAEGNPVMNTQGNEQKVVDYDEIHQFRQLRVMGSAEAMERILGAPVTKQSHVVDELPIHLIREHNISFMDTTPADEILKATENDGTLEGSAAVSKLTAFFKLVAEERQNPAYLLDSTRAPNLYYHQVVEKYWFNKNRWQRRIRNWKTIGRLQSIYPSEVELFCLRELLKVIKGPSCYEDLKMHDGRPCQTFREAAVAYNLYVDDSWCTRTMHEVATYASPRQLRLTYALLLIYNEPQNAQELWDLFQDKMLSKNQNISTDEQIRRAKAHVASILFHKRKFMEDYQMDPVDNDDIMASVYDTWSNVVTDGVERYATLNQMQKFFTDAVLKSFDFVNDAMRERMFFLQASGGTGKTYVFNTLIRILRQNGYKVLTVASTGIAAILLDGGQTAHSAFRIPIDLTKDANISATDPVAKYIREADCIVWDEAPMQHKLVFERVFKIIKQLAGPDTHHSIFANKTVILGGDFKQCLPVLKNENLLASFDASILCSDLFLKNFKVYMFDVNERAREDPEWADFLTDIGNGASFSTTFEKNKVQLPAEICVYREIDAIDFVYPEEIFDPTYPLEDYVNAVKDVALINPLNDKVADLNAVVVAKVQSPAQTYTAINTLPKESYPGDAMFSDDYNSDELDMLSHPSIPPHTLVLKERTVVMLTRNISVQHGLCNGTRLIVTHLMPTHVNCRIITGEAAGDSYSVTPMKNIFTPEPGDTWPSFQRFQLPIRPAYAITINKSQGQTLRKIGLILTSDCFAHGHLYVALSRVRRRADIKVYVDPKNIGITEDGERVPHATNVVFPQALKVIRHLASTVRRPPPLPPQPRPSQIQQQLQLNPQSQQQIQSGPSQQQQPPAPVQQQQPPPVQPQIRHKNGTLPNPPILMRQASPAAIVAYSPLPSQDGMFPKVYSPLPSDDEFCQEFAEPDDDEMLEEDPTQSDDEDYLTEFDEDSEEEDEYYD